MGEHYQHGASTLRALAIGSFGVAAFPSVLGAPERVAYVIVGLVFYRTAHIVIAYGLRAAKGAS